MGKPSIPADVFSKAPITITLTGEQWFALIAHALGRSLSNQGVQLYREAVDILRKELLAKR